MWWQMLLPSGRCYSHYRVGDGTVADVITTGQMLLAWVNVYFSKNEDEQSNSYEKEKEGTTPTKYPQTIHNCSLL